MTSYLKILDKPFEGEFDSSPYNPGFPLMTFKNMLLNQFKIMKMY